MDLNKNTSKLHKLKNKREEECVLPKSGKVLGRFSIGLNWTTFKTTQPRK